MTPLSRIAFHRISLLAYGGRADMLASGHARDDHL